MRYAKPRDGCFLVIDFRYLKASNERRTYDEKLKTESNLSQEKRLCCVQAKWKEQIEVQNKFTLLQENTNILEEQLTHTAKV